ncbi:hypothetical protein [Halorientalis salina]|uniref:hypothetical protein n=1 Tax=Halorientalis salina TaxID=2932266 RepID=UPI0010AC19EF|nr:hypothetical protein [Halorientalis salina]
MSKLTIEIPEEFGSSHGTTGDARTRKQRQETDAGPATASAVARTGETARPKVLRWHRTWAGESEP